MFPKISSKNVWKGWKGCHSIMLVIRQFFTVLFLCYLSHLSVLQICYTCCWRQCLLFTPVSKWDYGCFFSFENLNKFYENSAKLWYVWKRELCKLGTQVNTGTNIKLKLCMEMYSNQAVLQFPSSSYEGFWFKTVFLQEFYFSGVLWTHNLNFIYQSSIIMHFSKLLEFPFKY